MATGGYIEIVEEPKSSQRFRYVSEGTSVPLEGVRSTRNLKSFPSIKIMNYTGKAKIVVSCVTADEPHRQHPHRLLGENYVKGTGVCVIPDFYTNSADPTILSFPDLRIESCKKSEISERLEERKRFNINPFELSKYGEDDLKRDIHSVRLCFQVIYMPNPQNPQKLVQLQPIVSNEIINNKGAAEVKIVDISDTCSPAVGDKKIIILCNTIAKDRIEIHFYENDAEGRQTLIGLGKILSIHRNCGIVFTTPKYDLERNNKLANPPEIFIQMVRKSDGARSSPEQFRYIFDDIDTVTQKKQEKMNKSRELFDSLGEMQQHYNMVNQETQQHTVQTTQGQFNPQYGSQSGYNIPNHYPQQQQQHYNTVNQRVNLPQQVNQLQPTNVTHQHYTPYQHELQSTPSHQHNMQQQCDLEKQFNEGQQQNPVQTAQERNHNFTTPNHYPQQNQQHENEDKLFDLGSICPDCLRARSSHNDCYKIPDTGAMSLDSFGSSSSSKEDQIMKSG